jgi:hypothetical protein
MNKNIENNSSLSQVWRLWEQGVTYFQQKNFYNALQEWIDFYEGRQWGNSKLSRTFPKHTYNVIKMIIDAKTSNVTSTPIKLLYKSSNILQKTTKWNKFAEYQMRKMGQEKANRKAVLDGYTKGTYIYHYFWEEDSVSSLGIYKGDLNVEVIDMRQIAVADPTEKDIQKQKWIIVATREEVKAVIAKADKNGIDENSKQEIDISQIVADNNEIIANKVEQDKSGLCTVLTRYFRIDGEVYFERAVKGTLVNSARPLNPKISEKKLKLNKEKETFEENVNENEVNEILDIDAKITSLHDNKLEMIDKNSNKFYLYPIELSCLNERDGSIFGISEAESLIYSQKSLNLQMSLITKNAKDVGWSKWLVKKEALDGQEITDEGGQILYDNTPIGSGWGVQLMQGQQFAGGALDLASTIINLMRTVTNAGEIFTGDMISKDLSGTAIAQLQAQATKTTDAQLRALMTSLERCGKIIELFYKFYYDKAKYSFELDTMEKFNAAQNEGISEIDVPDMMSDEFSGNEFMDTEFDLVVEAGMGTRYSEILAMDTLNTLFINGGLQNMPPDILEQFVTLYPDSAMPFKNELMAIIKKQQSSENAMLKQNVEQLTNLLKQAQSKIQQQEMYNKQLTEEFTNKMRIASDMLKEMDNKNKIAEKVMLEESKEMKDNTTQS